MPSTRARVLARCRLNIAASRRRMWAVSMRFERSPSRHRATRRTKACRHPPCAASATGLVAVPLSPKRIEDALQEDGILAPSTHVKMRLEFVFGNRYDHFVCSAVRERRVGGRDGVTTCEGAVPLVRHSSATNSWPSVCARQSRISVLHCALRLHAEERPTLWSAAGIGGSRERAAGDAEPVGRNGG